MRFRLRHGKHEGKDSLGESKVWQQGQIIDTDEDLTRHDAPYSPKFERLIEAAGDSPGESSPYPQPGLPAPGDLGSLSTAQLKSLAKSEGVDVSGLTTKADIVAAIQSGRAE